MFVVGQKVECTVMPGMVGTVTGTSLDAVSKPVTSWVTIRWQSGAVSCFHHQNVKAHKRGIK